MKKIIALMLFITLANVGWTQSYQENLEKYWYYRHRLKTKFMLQTNNSDIQGSNLVAENISANTNPNPYMRWADGVWWHGAYIAVLAVEYRLLKDNGQPYGETLDELTRALEAYERLDISVGDCYENGYDNFDGFFMRDDQILNDEFTNKFPNTTIFNDYQNHCPNHDNGGLVSQDQIVQMFMGLLLTKKLVDDSFIQQKVVTIASAIVNREHHPDGLGIEQWEILNYFLHPAVPVEGGNIFELEPFIWAHATAASRITGNDEHTFNSHLGKASWDAAQNTILSHYNNTKACNVVAHEDSLTKAQGIWHPYTGYWIATLSALTNEPGGGEDNTYEWLIRFFNDTDGYLTMPTGIGLYPHLPLISEILDGYDGDERFTAEFLENSFLNLAPDCGSYHYFDSEGEHVSPVPWHTMSLNCPQHNGGSGLEGGEYNMIDYMLLYNAYFLNYLYGDYLPYKLNTGEYPVEEFEIRFDPEPPYYPDTTWYTLFTCEDPKLIHASRQIDMKTIIHSDGGVNCFAGSSVRLLPGFKVENGGCFIAKINDTLKQDIYYQETNVDPCNGGEFVPQPIIVNKNKDLYSKIENHNHSKSTLQSDDLLKQYTNKSLNKNFIIYPNPSKGVFNIKTLNQLNNIDYYVFNSYGKKVMSDKLHLDNSISAIDLSSLNPGIYILIINSDFSLITKKLIIN